MHSLRFRIARWVLTHQKLSWVFFALVTAFFIAGLPKVKLETIFSDLLPADDPFVQTFKDHPNFGNPLTVAVMIKRKDGDIYNAETIAKVWKFTRDIDLTPGVDHDLILSVTTGKARYTEATPYGIDMRPLMGDIAPSSPEDVALFKERVGKSPNTKVFLISNDDTATLITATFIEHKVDYGVVFDFVQKLAADARDEHHEIYVTGHPILIGWVYQYTTQMLLIFAVTVGALLLALILYMRNAVGILTPVITSATAAVWAFGLVGWLDVSIEPLLMVVPLLLIARSFSHSVQFTERYYEVYAHVKDQARAVEITMGVMMAPSILGIITDIIGIAVVAAAPIPAMWRHALFCGMWAVWLIPTGVVLISLLLAALPAPANVEKLIGHGESSGVHRRFQALLTGIAKLTYGKRARYTAAVLIVFSAAATWTAQQIKIGNPVEGTNLLWEDSDFNTAVRAINSHFPGVNTLELVLESKTPQAEDWNVTRAETVMTMLKLQNLMEQGENAPRATLSFNDYLRESNRLFQGGNPKWLPLDNRDRAVNAAAIGVMMGSSAKNYGHVIDDTMQHGTVSLWYKDNKQETVDAALAAARKAVAEVGQEHEFFRIRMATGIIALQEAVNIIVDRFHWVMLGLLNGAIFLLCSFAYRSFVAGFLLLVPVNLSNQVMIASMHLMGVGLDVNSLIVAAIGVGVGIDYGIYLLSRICEEYRVQNEDWGATITAALSTTGKAIMFTATIMAVGVLPWYFMSGLKFLADMGLLLVVIMSINMIMALLVLPLLVWFVKPKFVGREDMLVGESVDLSEFTTRDPDAPASA